MFCKKSVFRNFTKFTGKHQCQSLFYNKVTETFILIDPFVIQKTRMYSTRPKAFCISTSLLQYRYKFPFASELEFKPTDEKFIPFRFFNPANFTSTFSFWKTDYNFLWAFDSIEWYRLEKLITTSYFLRTFNTTLYNALVWNFFEVPVSRETHSFITVHCSSIFFHMTISTI